MEFSGHKKKRLPTWAALFIKTYCDELSRDHKFVDNHF